MRTRTSPSRAPIKPHRMKSTPSTLMKRPKEHKKKRTSMSPCRTVGHSSCMTIVDTEDDVQDGRRHRKKMTFSGRMTNLRLSCLKNLHNGGSGIEAPPALGGRVIAQQIKRHRGRTTTGIRSAFKMIPLSRTFPTPLQALPMLEKFRVLLAMGATAGNALKRDRARKKPTLKLRRTEAWSSQVRGLLTRLSFRSIHPSSLWQQLTLNPRHKWRRHKQKGLIPKMFGISSRASRSTMA
mmetsp:Transcript_35642/g.59084  ORF Transcript_35642/g.59084 Transcript_35642/m.59084 type:complete len:237 (-) Transcript_35642:989-1699(-)